MKKVFLALVCVTAFAVAALATAGAPAVETPEKQQRHTKQSLARDLAGRRVKLADQTTWAFSNEGANTIKVLAIEEIVTHADGSFDAKVRLKAHLC